ncbi:hypothetical protein [Virgibacillus halodenitrificans]|uniref:Uncharacterized protein n=1 Tax=Virgibacillus halodenitrificans TaxID=1482 RepID=A0ABR7VIY3_VIRHA|nr:hypothetical protein [Virgibacillus halodenitrificans]MBD1221890.1 hypothetical protein [Virgibacillus halodenitrificans]
MYKRLRTFLFGMLGVFVGMIASDIIRSGEINWNNIGLFTTIVFLILLFILGIGLYKKKDEN